VESLPAPAHFVFSVQRFFFGGPEICVRACVCVSVCVCLCVSVCVLAHGGVAKEPGIVEKKWYKKKKKGKQEKGQKHHTYRRALDTAAMSRGLCADITSTRKKKGGGNVTLGGGPWTRQRCRGACVRTLLGPPTALRPRQQRLPLPI
jgi:hypothetical protein